jgi:hypothetical protein
MQSRTHASARPLVLGVVVVLGFLMVLPASNMFSRRKPNLALYVPATVYDAEHPEFFRDELRKYPDESTDGRRICESIRYSWLRVLQDRGYMFKWYEWLSEVPLSISGPGFAADFYHGFGRPIDFYTAFDPVARIGDGKYYFLGTQYGRFIVPEQVSLDDLYNAMESMEFLFPLGGLKDGRQLLIFFGPPKLLVRFRELQAAIQADSKRFCISERKLLEQSCVPDAATAEKLAVEYKSETEGWLPKESIQGITLYRKTRPRTVLEGRGGDEFIWIVRFGRKSESDPTDIAAVTQEYWIDARSGFVRAIFPTDSAFAGLSGQSQSQPRYRPFSAMVSKFTTFYLGFPKEFQSTDLVHALPLDYLAESFPLMRDWLRVKPEASAVSEYVLKCLKDSRIRSVVELFTYIYCDTAVSHDNGIPLLWMCGPICTVWLVQLGRDIPGFGKEGDLVWIANQAYNPSSVRITLEFYPYFYRQVWVNAMNGKMFSILSADPYEVARRIEVSSYEEWVKWLRSSTPEFRQEF